MNDDMLHFICKKENGYSGIRWLSKSIMILLVVFASFPSIRSDNRLFHGSVRVTFRMSILILSLSEIMKICINPTISFSVYTS